ncbi:hypothetical protein MY10362_009859, partial [Beauveria mimosiformis]
MAVPIDTTPAAQILERVLERCTARLRQPQPQPQPGVRHTTEDEIVHYA